MNTAKKIYLGVPIALVALSIAFFAIWIVHANWHPIFFRSIVLVLSMGMASTILIPIGVVVTCFVRKRVDRSRKETIFVNASLGLLVLHWVYLCLMWYTISTLSFGN